MTSAKIAVVVPVPQPPVRGGAENLYEGLRAGIETHHGAECEIVGLPSPEGSFWDVIKSYRKFALLDLSGYDRVISTKYPSWMVDHPDHVCYMLHKLRGLYDTYHFFGLPLAVDYAALPEPARFLEKALGAPIQSREQLLRLLDSILALEPACSGHPGFALPGPLARAVVHRLDAFGMRKGAVRKFAAISRTVADREDYFPAGARVDVVYPDTGATTRTSATFDYFFTASRLDGPKRIDLIVAAFRKTRGDVRLVIAGTGPDEPRLRQLAQGDRRIEFLGYVDDQQLAQAYSEARAVVFVPYDEDLGYITIEAMRSGKAVITTTDSGGPTEFVHHGGNGFVVAPDPDSLAAAMQAIIDDPSLAVSMGAAATQAIRGIGWEQATSALMASESVAYPAVARPSGARDKVVLLNTFPVYPPRGGGQARLFHLWRHVAKGRDVVAICSVGSEEEASDQLIAPGFREIRVPRDPAHVEFETNLSRGLDWMPVSDIAFAMAPELAVGFRRACEQELGNAALCVLVHPYAAPVIQDLALPEVWHESFNHEASMKAGMLPRTAAGRAASEAVKVAEAMACRMATTTLCVSESDRRLFGETYDMAGKSLLLVPNGVDLDSVTFVPSRQRALLRSKFGLEGRDIVLILASWHGPNIEAVASVIAAAADFASTDFLVIGSAASAFEGQEVPTNVVFLGVITDEEKDLLLGCCTVALNPMRSGGGSNLKIFDYMASGAATVTSEFGARGSGIDASHAWIFGNENFDESMAAALSEALASSEEVRDRKARSARYYVEKHYSWSVIAQQIIDRLQLGT